MGQPLHTSQEAMLAHAEQAEQMALMLDGTIAFDPGVFHGMMTAAFGPAGAPFTTAFMAAFTNQHVNAEEMAAALHAHAQAVHESALEYETTEELGAAELAADQDLAQELADQLDSVKSEADKFEPFKESPEPPPGMPPPPPDPPIPDDVAAYNSETNPWDKAAAVANKAEARTLVQGYFKMKGWDVSSDMIGKYLENTGNPVVLPDSAMNTIVNDPQVAPILTDQLDKSVKTAVDAAVANPALYGVPQAEVRPWQTVITRDNDLANADGHFSVATTSLVTVNPPDEHGQITYSVEHQEHMYDYYYFHQTESGQWYDPEFLSKQRVDMDMRMLEAEGWAKSFKVHGSGATTTTTGVYDGTG